jgi:hypothetical protein
MSTQQIQLRRNAYGKRILKIVLTGGPCAGRNLDRFYYENLGKTSAMLQSADKIKQMYGNIWQVSKFKHIQIYP